MSIKHPVLKYYGSKFRLAEWIIEHFPKHRHYVEPFGGAANVLLIKNPSNIETYNDLNNELVNFFRVLREKPDELIQQISLTPWSRKEFEYCLDEIEIENPIEKARKLFFKLWMSLAGGMIASKGNWRRQLKGKRPLAVDIRPETLYQASQRLKLVQIENRDAFKLIAETDSPDTLFYLDPPYMAATRTDKKVYAIEMDDKKHQEFGELIRSVKGFVVLSGYPTKDYAEMFEKFGWRRIDKKANINGGAARIESLWLSPKTSEALLQQ